MNKFSDYFPWCVCGLVVIYLGVIIANAQPSQRKDKANLDAFGRLPAMHNGRVIPLDSLARTDLMLFSGRESFPDLEGQTQPATKWLLDVMSVEAALDLSPTSPAGKHRVFRIKDADLLKRLGLDPRDGFYAYEEFAAKLTDVEKDQKHGDMMKDRSLRELQIQVNIYKRLASGRASQYKVFRIENEEVLAALGLKARSGLRYSIEEFLPKVGILWDYFTRLEQQRVTPSGPFDARMLDLSRNLLTYVEITHGSMPQVIPPLREGDTWRRMAEVGAGHPYARAFAEILVANIQEDAAAFNETVQILAKVLRERLPDEIRRADFESFFNHFAPFDRSEILYCGVFLLVCGSFFGYSGPLLRAAFWLCAIAVVIHTIALIFRIYLTGLPPVINLYASAVFIGWGAVLLCMGLEWIWNNGISLLAGSLIGVLTLIIATKLGAGNDTMGVLEPVLRTRFWLATHVTCVALGYTATFVAGALGIAYIVTGVFTPFLDDKLSKGLAKAVYGTICFATLLSFTGTVLGGIWADQSWGRFWGWDPKENGALLIVLWNALSLHARWGGMIKQRGLAVLAVGGNIVTAWSWFGVNMLGVGLHSYGFMEGAVFWLLFAVGTQLVIMAIGLLPLKMWRSFNVTRAPQIALPPPEPKLPKDFGKRKKGRADIKPGPAPA
jgi:ABC-type transport system involved in cytochrome c biogenesis permease subunit